MALDSKWRIIQRINSLVLINCNDLISLATPADTFFVFVRDYDSFYSCFGILKNNLKNENMNLISLIIWNDILPSFASLFQVHFEIIQFWVVLSFSPKTAHRHLTINTFLFHPFAAFSSPVILHFLSLHHCHAWLTRT